MPRGWRKGRVRRSAGGLPPAEGGGCRLAARGIALSTRRIAGSSCRVEARESLTSTAGRQRPQQWKPSFLATVASAHTSKGISQRARRAETDTSARGGSGRGRSACIDRCQGAGNVYSSLG